MRFIFTKPHKIITALILVSFVITPFFFLATNTNAAPNYQMNYQGKLLDASNVAVENGVYNMRFWLLTSPTIATTSAVWVETLTGTNRVQVTNGLFSVMLGSTTPLTSVDFNQTLYLGVEIGGSTTPTWDGEMSPRKILGTVPAAFEAENANTLDDLTSTQFVRTDATSTIRATSTDTLLTITQNGTGDIFNLFDGLSEVFTVTDGGRVGIGTSSPITDLSVDGDFALTGGLYDNNSTRGTDGYILKTNGAGIEWVSTTSLNFFDGTYFDTSAELAGILTDETGTGLSVFNNNPLLAGFRSNASSTIGDGTATGGLTIYGGATTTRNAYFASNVGIGSSSPVSLLTLDKSGLTGAVIGGITEYLQFTNSTQDAVYYGDNAMIINTPTATSTLVGSIIRIIDNTSFGNTVRGLEVQAHRGTSTKGENTGINAFGRTFGIKGTTEGDAGEVARPAGVFAETRGATQGNALRAYSGTLTTEDLVSFFHDTSAFLGTALAIDMGNDGGTFNAASSRFIDLKNGGVSQFAIMHNGYVGIGSSTPSRKLTLQGGDAYFGGNLIATGTLNISGLATLGYASTTGLTTSNIFGTNSSITYASSTALSVSGNTYLSGLSDGCLSTVSGLVTSSGSACGSGSADGVSNWIYNGSRLTPSSTVGIGVFASSTIGGGTGVTGLTINGNSTTTLNAYFGGTLSIGSTSPSAKLSIVGSGTSNLFNFASSSGSTLLALDTRGVLMFGTTTSANIFLQGGPTSTLLTDTTLLSNNIAIGNGAFSYASSTTLTSNNVAIGFSAMQGSSTVPMYGDNNVAIGPYALQNSTLSSYSIAIGYKALQNSQTTIANTAVGNSALRLNTTGAYNTAIGQSALELNATGTYNTAVGDGAMYSHFSGDNNVAVGESSMNFNKFGSGNTAIGDSSLSNSESGSNNSAVGFYALYNYTGTGTIGIGYKAGDALTNGHRNIIMGYNNDFANASTSFGLNIGNLIYGNNLDGEGTTMSSGNIGIGSSTPSRRLTVGGDIYTVNNISAASSTITYASSTALTVSGNSYLTYASTTGISGTNLAISGNTTLSGLSDGCLSTVSGLVTSSGVACGSGGGSSNWLFDGTRLTPSTTPVGIVLNASSTIGDGTGTGGLTIYGTATTTNLKITSLTASRGIFTDANNLLTTSGVSQYLIDSLSDETGTGSLVFSTNPLLAGFRSSASSTIGDGTATGGLTIYGGATTTGILKVLGTGTSTYAGGIALSGGCFQDTSGTCIKSAGDTVVVVAANDSPAAEKSYADYVADGTHDEVQIQQAIDYVYSNGGGTVHLLDGTFTVGTTTYAYSSINLATSTKLIGQGASTIVKIQNSFSSSLLTVFEGSGVADTVISNLYIDGNQTNQSSLIVATAVSLSGSASTSVIDHVVVDGLGGFLGGIAFSINGSGHELTNNEIKSGTQAITVSGANHKILSNQIYGISNGSGEAVVLNGQSHVFSNNIVIGNDYDGVGIDGSEIIVSDNIISNNVGIGIDITSSTAEKNQISGNMLEENYYGVRLFTAVRRNQITNNTVIGSDYQGIYLSGADENIISNNSMYNNGLNSNSGSIHLRNGSDDNLISNNFIDASSTDDYALYIDDSASDRNVVEGNIFLNYDSSDGIVDNGTGTRYDQWNRTTLTSSTQQGYSLLSIVGSTSVAMASTTQLGTGKIFSYSNSAGEALTLSNQGYLGIGSTTPSRKLTLSGGDAWFGGNITAASSTITYASSTGLTATNLFASNSTLGYASSTSLTVSGNTYLSGLSDGCLSTVSGLVTSSGSACGSGGGGSNWLFDGSRLTPSTTPVGISITGSSTIGGGTGATGLTIYGGATTTGNAYFGGLLGVGTTTPSATLSVAGTGNTNLFAFASSTGSTLLALDPRGVLMFGTTTSANIFLQGGSTTTSPVIGLRNIGIGYQTLQYTDTVDDNIAMGYQALYGSSTASMTGDYNQAIGYQTLMNNTTGYANAAIGYQALRANTTGLANTALGGQALLANTTGWGNFAAGFQVLRANTTGAGNIAVGSDGYGSTALWNNTTGSYNIAQGWGALLQNTSGNNNVALGQYSGDTISIGNGNTFLGVNADATSNSLSTSTAIGAGAIVGCSNCLVLGGLGADYANVGIGTTTPSRFLTVQGGDAWFGGNITGTGTMTTIGGFNVSTSTGLAGYRINNAAGILASTTLNNYFVAGASSTSFTNSATDNYAVGDVALKNLSTGDYNIAIGSSALRSFDIFGSALDTVMSGNSNTALGAAALYSNTTGSNNFAVGFQALLGNTTGDYNIAIGGDVSSLSALRNNTVGSNNIAIGRGSLLANTTGANNIALGLQALDSNTGTGTIAIGYRAGENATGVDRSIFIGYDIDAFSTTQDDALNIGNLLFGTGVDGTGTTLSTGNIGIGTSSPSRKLTVNGDIYGANITGTGTALFANLLVTGSSTIGGGTGATGLTINGTATTTNLKITALSDGCLSTVSGLVTSSGSACGSGGGSSNWLFDGTRLTPSTTPVGISITGSSTIGGGTGATGLTIYGGATTTGNAYFGGMLSLGSTTPSAMLSVAGTGNTNLFTFASSSGSTLLALDARGVLMFGTTTTADIFINGGSSTQNPQQNGNNIVVGNQSFVYASTTDFAQYNIAIGAQALYGSSTIPMIGDHNVAIGIQALANNASGTSNIAIGSLTLFNNSTGWANTAVGYGSQTSNTTGYQNVSFGMASLQANTQGYQNAGFGYASMLTNTTGTDNTGSGWGSLAFNSTGVQNSAFGSQAMFQSTGSYNTAQGYKALAASGSGDGNTATGWQTLITNTSGAGNSGVGYSALGGNISGSFNSAIGINAGLTNTTGGSNTYLGFGADGSGSGFSTSTAIGAKAVVGCSNCMVLGGTGVNYVNVGIGTTTPSALLTIGATGVTGSTVAGVKQHFGFINSVADAVYYGNETYITNVPTATSTLVANMIRIADTSALGNTVRGFEAQAFRGTNTKGENTGLSGFGRTFGVRGTTIGDAGDTYLPAGVFAETQGTTQGNALRAYSGTITTASLVSLFHDESHFIGTGLQMNFGNTDGSFAATTSAKFLDFQVAGTSKFTVAANGSTTIGDGTVNAGLRIPRGGICVDNDGSCISTTTGQIRSVTSVTGNSDLAEMYFSKQSLHAGEIVALDGGLSVKRAEEETNGNIIGVVSTKPGLTLGFDDTSLIAGERGYPVGLQGRVPIKLSTENGEIKKGDRIALSSTPGVGMKATESSRVVGIALEDYDGTRAYTAGFLNQFGDDMVKERIATRAVVDPRTQDGCSYGGGAALGDEECIAKTLVTSTEVKAVVDTTREDTLRALTQESAQQMTTEEGEVAYIGQALMFIQLTSYQIAGESLVLSELASTTLLENGAEGETIWSRIKTLAQNFVDGVLSVTGIKADRVEVKNELCVDGVCVTADDLRAILQNAHQGSQNTNTNTGDNGTSVDPGTSSPPPSTGENTGSGGGATEPTPEVTTSPEPTPEPEQAPETTPEPEPSPEISTPEPEPAAPSPSPEPPAPAPIVEEAPTT